MGKILLGGIMVTAGLFMAFTPLFFLGLPMFAAGLIMGVAGFFSLAKSTAKTAIAISKEVNKG